MRLPGLRTLSTALVGLGTTFGGLSTAQEPGQAAPPPQLRIPNAEDLEAQGKGSRTPSKPLFVPAEKVPDLVRVQRFMDAQRRGQKSSTTPKDLSIPRAHITDVTPLPGKAKLDRFPNHGPWQTVPPRIKQKPPALVFPDRHREELPTKPKFDVPPPPPEIPGEVPKRSEPLEAPAPAPGDKPRKPEPQPEAPKLKAPRLGLDVA